VFFTLRGFTYAQSIDFSRGGSFFRVKLSVAWVKQTTYLLTQIFSHLHLSSSIHLLQLRRDSGEVRIPGLGFGVSGGCCSPPAMEGGPAAAGRPNRGGGSPGGKGAAGLGGGGWRLGPGRGGGSTAVVRSELKKTATTGRGGGAGRRGGEDGGSGSRFRVGEGIAIVFENWKEKGKGRPSVGSGEVSDCDFAARLWRLLASLCVSLLLFFLSTCIHMCTCVCTGWGPCQPGARGGRTSCPPPPSRSALDRSRQWVC
jgi:hypothetical protein